MTVYLTGVTNDMVRAHSGRDDLGILVTPDTNGMRKDIAHFPIWAADNGCFSQAKPFDEGRWLAWLDSMPREGCLWATAPDVVGSHERTVERSAGWLPIIRQLGFRAAFVAQNGATVENVPWDDFDALFIGGVPECRPCGFTREAADFRRRHCPTCGAKLTEWKCSDQVEPLIVEAHRRGMLVHVGRVNSRSRFEWCRDHEADSADGTMIKFAMRVGVDNLISWLDAQAVGAAV